MELGRSEDTSGAASTAKRFPMVIAVGALAAVLAFFLLGPDPAAEAPMQIATGITLTTDTTNTTPEPATATPSPTAEPTPSPTPLAVIEAPAPTATATEAEPTPTPEPTAVPEADDAASDDSSAGETVAEPTATPAPNAEAQPTATAAPAPTPTTTAAVETPTATAVVEAPTATQTTTIVATATPAPVAPVGELPAYSSGGSFTYALVAKPTTAKARIYDSPGGQELQVTYEYLSGDVVLNDLVNPTYFGNPLSLRVVRGAPGDEWALVELPTRPNGQTGWVQTSPYDWSSSNHLVRINVSTNSVTIWEGDTVVLETAAVTGKSSSPTPVLTGYVDEKIRGLGGAYGPVLLSLAVYSNSLNTFGANGEVPKIALHGTNAPQLMGQYASNGCIRVPNDIIEQIASIVPVGSKVEIVR